MSLTGSIVSFGSVNIDMTAYPRLQAWCRDRAVVLKRWVT